MLIDPTVIEEVRCASRTMVRELGFMRATLAGTCYSPSAVHALLEIELNQGMTAARLVGVLGLDKSSLSRMLGKLIKADEILEVQGSGDGRVKQLVLTEKGKATVAEIHRYGHRQVSAALAQLNLPQQQAVAQGLRGYAQALSTLRLGTIDPQRRPIEIVSGYQPGLIGRVTEMHASFYSRNWGFSAFFERQVASGLSGFVGRLDQPGNCVWAALHNGRVVGSVAIDGQDLGNNEAHLRWFILDEGCRGGGVGRRLLNEAIAFCHQSGFGTIQLWTFKGLDAARRLYEACGFELTEEYEGSQWGVSVTEQQFTFRM